MPKLLQRAENRMTRQRSIRERRLEQLDTFVSTLKERPP